MQDTAIPTINEIQDEIIQAFHVLVGDKESMLTYLMELGNKMVPLDEQYKVDKNTIAGCMSTVWLIHQKQGDRLFFAADSNTAITKGLISLLLRVLSGQKAKDIIHAKLYFIQDIGMSQLIGFQRSNGFANMLKQLKMIALAYQ